MIAIHKKIIYNPLQQLTEKYIGEDCNLIVQAPTSSGKTIVAEQFIYPTLVEGRRAIYLSPLKALTSEKMEDWNSIPFSKIAITSDFDTPAAFHHQLVLMTTESLDSKTRGGREWLKNVGCLVADEAHMLAMDRRGDAFEIGLTRFATINSDARIVFLSATFPNVEEVAEWLTILNGKPTRIVETEWRPVSQEHYLVKGPNQTRKFFAGLLSLYDDIRVKNPNKQILIFVHSISQGRDIAKEIGCEFHYSRLSKTDRAAIEDKFRKRRLGTLVSTSTLAYGVNLPADIGIIVGSTRGLEPVDPSDIKQMAGRIGRYGMSDKGKVFYYFRENVADEHYKAIFNIPPVESVLKNRLYFHITSLIAREEMQIEQINSFISKTLGQLQHGVKSMIPEAIDLLIQYDIIRQQEDKYIATSVGKASALMYVDPIDLSVWKKNFTEQPMNPTTIAIAYASVPSYAVDCWVPDTIESPIHMAYGYQTLIATGVRDWLRGIKLDDYLQTLTVSHVRDFRRIVSALSITGINKAYMKLLGIMMVNGVMEHLVKLVEIKGIGRKKAQSLYNCGIREPKDIIDNVAAKNILGAKLYSCICNQLNPTNGKIIVCF